MSCRGLGASVSGVCAGGECELGASVSCCGLGASVSCRGLGASVSCCGLGCALGASVSWGRV